MRNRIMIFLLSALVLSGCGSSDIGNYIKDKIVKYDEGLVEDTGEVDNSPVGSISQKEIDEALEAHNLAREEVGVETKLSWDNNLAVAAQHYADKMAQTGVWEHDYEGNDKYGYGENLYTSTTNPTLKVASDAWIAEKEYYSYGKVGDSSTCSKEPCGHYTQIIWKTTSRVGCAKSKYTTGQYKDWFIVVCKYQERGNYNGETPY